MATVNRLRRRYDVIIVGAGIAGCATAIALLQQIPNLSVLLLERSSSVSRPFRIGETLPPQTMLLLQQLGLSESFLARGDMAAMGTRSIWGSVQVHEYPFWFSCYGHGWHIDRTSFDSWMVRHAERAGATVIFGSTLTGTQNYRHGWRVTVHRSAASTVTFETALVVDASGRGSAFCRKLGLRANKLDRLTGIFRFFQDEENDTACGDASFTLIESDVAGWWYSARLPQGQWIAALMTDSDLARDMDVLGETGWFKALVNTSFTRTRFEKKTPLSPLQVKPARSQCLQQFCGPGWYAAGDAACVFDPLSSLGIFKALRHGLLASYAIRDELQGKPDAISKYQHLLESEFKQYQHTRRQYYQLEKRFVQAPFWQRRQQQKHPGGA
ncbi:Dehydrogenase (flavoprotein) [Nitrosomonas sp. Nm51]|uniref:NAD(P)/FAD-dependent oxidoreductase n=1 Tax=Nitrosomonas sp. Nm51 TaxID=133720 RepID=UPI0008AD704A|nr:NAD(P)/FAD-dependent oxidoreductase [Nitrosomonas sp. Nm51]SER15079.1 Dehydrogenase (flavoprotein) [Nitrosomonas sp. Nm51]